MKNIKIVFLLIGILILTGCTTTGNKLVKYLESVKYECLQNICVLDSNEDGLIKVKTIYDIDSTTYKKETTFSSVQSSTMEYNWSTKKVKYEFKLITDVFNVDYDAQTQEYECTSNSEDKDFKNAECKQLVNDIENDLKSFNTVIDLSGYKID